MKHNRYCPSHFVSGLPPKSGGRYRVAWKRLDGDNTTLSTLRYEAGHWLVRDSDQRWIAFHHADEVVGHGPVPLKEYKAGDRVRLVSNGSVMKEKQALDAHEAMSLEY